MKKLLRISIIAALLTATLIVSAFAMAGDGLNTFEDVADMTSYTFTDCPSNSWCFSNVKIAYDKGIIMGYEDDTFRQDQAVNWSQAVAIAARIHAAYYGNAINQNLKPGEPWYANNLRYCQAHKLLPNTCPTSGNLGDYLISRYDLAYIFSRCISKDDMPVISSRPITDWNNIPEYYRESVKTVYEAGIMTGYADYSFGGTIATSRGHIACVVARLLVPAHRVGYDPKINADMADIESNLENDAVAVKCGDCYYCIYKYYNTTQTEKYGLYKVTFSGNSVPVYTTGTDEYLNNVSLYNGKVYFCQTTKASTDGKLLCLDPSNDRISTVYNGAVESYCFYNGQLYALLFSNYSENVSDYKYTFGKIENGRFTKLMDTLGYYEAMYFQPYGWNGSIYFKLSHLDDSDKVITNLYSYNLSSGEVAKLSNLNINTSFFDGHRMYFMIYDQDGNYDLNLYEMSIQAPGAINAIGEFPAGCNNRYRSIYKDGDSFYCLAAVSRNLYRMDTDGSSRVALNCRGIFSALCYAGDKTILIPVTLVTSNMNELRVYESDSLSAREIYSDWVGQSCYAKGAHFVPENDNVVYTSGNESVSTVSNLEITVTSAFTREGGDLVVRAKYKNNEAYDLTLRMYTVRVYLGDELVAFDINKMVSMDMKQYDIQTFTFVISGDDLRNNFQITADNVDDISIEIYPTFDIISTETQSDKQEVKDDTEKTREQVEEFLNNP